MPTPTFTLEARRDARLLKTFREAWADAVGTGLVAYDPGGSDVEVIVIPPYRYHFLPRRATRPGAQKSPTPPPEGIRWPHSPCPFDGEEFVRVREALRLERDGRIYHVVCNHYPVTPYHFLPVRSWKEPAARLPQHLGNAQEIEDLLLLLVMSGPPHHVYFNSNRGADNSQSGSSVNHWHGQLFPLPLAPEDSAWTGAARILRSEEGLRVGRMESWPAAHLLVEGLTSETRAISEVIWREANALNDLNVAYNLEGVLLGEEGLRVFLFPRHPGPDTEVAGLGSLNPNFGGWELTGDIVIPTKEILEWIRRHPADATRLTTKRLRETTREPLTARYCVPPTVSYTARGQ